MAGLCRVSIEEHDNDRETYGDVDWCAKSIAEHKALKVLLLTGFDDRFDEYIEERYNDPDLYPQYEFLFRSDNGDERSALGLYLNNNLNEQFMKFIEAEADALASIILG